MKKFLVFAFAVMMTATSWASGEKFVLAPGAGVAICLEEGYDLGFGGSLFGGIEVQPGLALGANVGFYTFSATGSTSDFGLSSSSLEFTGALRYAIGTDKVRPVLTAAAGFTSYIVTLTLFGDSASGSELYPLLSAGAGVEFEAGENFGIFVATKFAAIIGDGGTFKYLPVEVGASF